MAEYFTARGLPVPLELLRPFISKLEASTDA